MPSKASLKLNLLSFLESHGAYSESGHVVLPGGAFADLTEFLPQSGVDKAQLEDLLQQMRESWQLAAFWLNGKWMAFYTPLGHQELDRLRGTQSAPPGPTPAMESFWLNLESGLRQKGLIEQAGLVNQLRIQPAVMQAAQLACNSLKNNGNSSMSN